MDKSDTTKFSGLTTGRLVLRQLEDSDAPAIATLRSDDAVNAYIQRPKQLSPDGARAFVEKINNGIKDGKYFYWAICLRDNPGLIGTACLFNFTDENTCAELGYELIPGFQGQGIADEAVKEVIAFAFKSAGFKMLEACVHQNHAKSINLLLKNNFIPDENRKYEKSADYCFYTLAG